MISPRFEEVGPRRGSVPHPLLTQFRKATSRRGAAAGYYWHAVACTGFLRLPPIFGPAFAILILVVSTVISDHNLRSEISSLRTNLEILARSSRERIRSDRIHCGLLHATFPSKRVGADSSEGSAGLDFWKFRQASSFAAWRPLISENVCFATSGLRELETSYKTSCVLFLWRAGYYLRNSRGSECFH